MTTKTGYIYTLSDPRTDEVRYVGATKYPEQRLHQHLTQPPNDEMADWINSLDSECVTPVMNVINVAEVSELSRKERTAVQRLSERFDLLNKQRGGHNYNPGTSAQATPNQRYEPDDDEEEQILQVLKDEGRVNPLRIREQTDLGTGCVSRKLDNLVRAGWVRRVTRGLYEFADDPRDTEQSDVGD